MASRRLRPIHKPSGALSVMASLLRSRFSASVSCGILLLLIVSATILICYEAHYIAMHLKTVAGDNLRPTPWHKFPFQPQDAWSHAARLPRILKCNYLSCLNEALSTVKHSNFYPNATNTCPSYFQWIYEDLAPWQTHKITTGSLKAAQEHAAFRVIIVGGRLYTEFYYACVLPRVSFTLWGLLQLLTKYPGMIPDVDLMFDCMDRPSVQKVNYMQNGSPPPLFRYCGHKGAFDIPFPDWSFWGWPQIHMAPWANTVEDIYKGSKETKWEDRKPIAYWKGNPDVGSKVREDLLRCNRSEDKDWGAEIYRQDWGAEYRQGFRNSKLSEQCKNRFKIYAEGHAWSVSFKYIFACDSPVLVSSPTYYEFFSRSLIPMEHFWPIRRDDLCPSIKFATDWGNKHPEEAKVIGKAGQEFVWRSLSTENVYDYMFHLLTEYSKLQSFKPIVPATAQLLCKKTLLCFMDDDTSKVFMKMSEVESASSRLPCTLTPFGHHYIEELEQKAENTTQKIWMWEEMAKKNGK